MVLNLINSPWLPVRRMSGASAWIVPSKITSDFASDPILSLDFPRADWNGAVAELLIGLLTCVMPPQSDRKWAERWSNPPLPNELAERLAAVSFAFELGGDGPRCFQDLASPDDSWKERPIEWLVLAGPVENTQNLNTDLFSKRGRIEALSAPFAAAALITQQTYAPEGGPGFRTSMRGGGPLTTLVNPRRKLPNQSVGTTLWDLVWSNVPSEMWCDSVQLRQQGEFDPLWKKIFPWLSATQVSPRGEPTIAADAHPLQSFFGMPCRIRLNISYSLDQVCSFHGPGEWGIVRYWRTRPHGTNYVGWKHPLSPYQMGANHQVLAVHPRPGTSTYQHWSRWLMPDTESTVESSSSVIAWHPRLSIVRALLRYGHQEGAVELGQTSVCAYGYDFKKNKARGWLELRIPYFTPPEGVDQKHWSEQFVNRTNRLVAGAERAGSALRYAVRIAAFGVYDTGRQAYALLKNSSGGKAYDDLYETFWRVTEPDFIAAQTALRDSPEDEDTRIRTAFLSALRREALRLFDETAGTDTLAERDARRIVAARSNLGFKFGETGEVRAALDILTSEAQAKRAGRKSAKSTELT